MSYACPHVIHMAYTWLTHVIHMSFTCLSHVIHMSYRCHTHVIHMAYTWHTHVIHMSDTCHTHVIHMSYTCHTHVMYMPYTCRTLGTHMAYQVYGGFHHIGHGRHESIERQRMDCLKCSSCHTHGHLQKGTWHRRPGHEKLRTGNACWSCPDSLDMALRVYARGNLPYITLRYALPGHPHWFCRT